MLRTLYLKIVEFLSSAVDRSLELGKSAGYALVLGIVLIFLLAPSSGTNLSKRCQLQTKIVDYTSSPRQRSCYGRVAGVSRYVALGG